MKELILAREHISDLIELADFAMSVANQCCGEFNRKEELKDARDFLEYLTESTKAIEA